MLGATYPSNDLFLLYAFRLLCDRIMTELKRLAPADTLQPPAEKQDKKETAAAATSAPLYRRSRFAAPFLSAEELKTLSALQEVSETDPNVVVLGPRALTPVVPGPSRSLLLLALQLVQVFDYSLLVRTIFLDHDYFDRLSALFCFVLFGRRIRCSKCWKSSSRSTRICLCTWRCVRSLPAQWAPTASICTAATE